MERKLGEIFKDNGTFLKVTEPIKKGHCPDCYYSDKYLCYRAHMDVCQGECSGSERTDKTSVIFKEIKTMTKSDLKLGMVVECKDGDCFLVLNENLAVGLCDCYLRFNDLDENLVCWVCEDVTIVKVYNTDKVKCMGFESILKQKEELTLIWERPREVVLTMEQIAQKFEVDVNQLKIKK